MKRLKDEHNATAKAVKTKLKGSLQQRAAQRMTDHPDSMVGIQKCELGNPDQRWQKNEILALGASILTNPENTDDEYPGYLWAYRLIG